jgi:hypothetical protein
VVFLTGLLIEILQLLREIQEILVFQEQKHLPHNSNSNEGIGTALTTPSY